MATMMVMMIAMFGARVKDISPIGYTSRVAADFCVPITAIGCHGNKGRSGVSLNDTVQLANLESPLFGARIRDVSPLQAKL